MHFMEWRPTARAAARSRWYAAVDAAVAASAGAVAQRVVRLPAELLSTAAPPQAAASPAAAAVSVAQPASVRQPVAQHPPSAPAVPSDDAAGPDGKPAVQGQGRLVSLVARAAGSWRGPRPSLLTPTVAQADGSAAHAVAPHRLELQRSSSSPLSSQLRARFEGLAAVVAPEAAPHGEAAARRRALGGSSRRRLQVSNLSEVPRGVAVH